MPSASPRWALSRVRWTEVVGPLDWVRVCVSVPVFQVVSLQGIATGPAITLNFQVIVIASVASHTAPAIYHSIAIRSVIRAILSRVRTD